MLYIAVKSGVLFPPILQHCRQYCNVHGHGGKDGVRSTEYGVRSTEYGVRSTECGVRSAEYGVRSTEYGVRSLSQLKCFFRFGGDF